eukprot:Selendium_serpulae@DN4001_c0_g1_i3.p1
MGAADQKSGQRQDFNKPMSQDSSQLAPSSKGSCPSSKGTSGNVKCPKAEGTGTGQALKSPGTAEGKRICCVCKETKAARDDCITLNGESKCRAFIDAHNRCLRFEGFDVE